MTKDPRTVAGAALILQGFRHDLNCKSIDLGLDDCDCAFPSLVRNIEDEARSELLALLVHISNQVKPREATMQGPAMFSHSERRSKEIWYLVNEILDIEMED